MVRKVSSRDLWEARYTASDGRKRSIYAKTQREAQEKLRAALIEADQNIAPIRERITVGRFLDEWLATSVSARCRPRTIASYSETVQQYVVPSIGRYQLAKLGPEHVARMLSDLRARGTLSPTTMRYAHTVLRIALGRALKAGQVSRNVATLVDPPARNHYEMHPLTADQVVTFLSSAEPGQARAIYVTAIGTGLRQGELLGLRWSDVDLTSGILAVRHTLEIGTRVLAEPKTDRARRTLRLPSSVLEGLRDHRRRQAEGRIAAGSTWIDSDLVFTTRQGRPLSARNVLRTLHHDLERAGLPRQRFHDLRHAYATLLLERGEELGVISRTLGHSQISTTADVYAHLTPAILDRTADRMEGILTGRKRASGA